MPVWHAQLDDHTCDWCQQRHGKDARPPSPRLKCTNPEGCRCVAVDAPAQPAAIPTISVQSAGVPVVYHVTWSDGARGYFHTLLAAAPIAGALVECPGVDKLLPVGQVVYRREAVVLRCAIAEPLTPEDATALRAVGWGFA